MALGKLGMDVLVLMPKYRGIGFTEKHLSDRVTVRLIEHEAFFNRASLYGNGGQDYADNLDRFLFFSTECLALTKRLDFKPDLVHVHDWHTALIPVLLKTRYAKDDFFKKAKTLLTIHNLAYQGQFDGSEYSKLGLSSELFSMDGFEFYGKVNLLKAGLLYADCLNTVSQTYAQEIQTREFGFGLEGILQKRKNRLHGILNGIDPQIWNPETDSKIAQVYSLKDFSGKRVCKEFLQKKCGFSVDPKIPVLAVVSRLAHQKGMDILAEAIPAMMREGVQLAIVGDGDSSYKSQMESLEKKYPTRMKVFAGFQVQEAHDLYAGADLFLMPSLFEPCGLGQMISMRYGTIPVVRSTGGLKDTVVDATADPTRGNGFSFVTPTPEELMKVLSRALSYFQEKQPWNQLMERAMAMDFSWDESAKKYVELYREMSA